MQAITSNMHYYTSSKLPPPSITRPSRSRRKSQALLNGQLHQTDEGKHVLDNYDISDDHWDRVRESSSKERRARDDWGKWFTGERELGHALPVKEIKNGWELRGGLWQRTMTEQEEDCEDENEDEELEGPVQVDPDEQRAEEELHLAMAKDE